MAVPAIVRIEVVVTSWENYSTTKPTGWTHGLIVSTVIFITARRYYKIFVKYN